jgi:hypothetical protein
MIRTMLAAAAPVLATSAVFSFIILNWLAGCGERFPLDDGTYEVGACIIPTMEN